jgi:peptidoglycan/xylan/chitin deacetylase (PgdA/CDA1 family)
MKRRVERALSALIPRRKNRVAVLCYHSVDSGTAHASVDPVTFGAHLDWLGGHCDVVRFEDLRGAPRDSTRPTVAITFDDGYLDNYEHAYPLLLERDMPATFFITTGLIDRDAEVIRFLGSLWGSGPGEVKPMTWDNIRDMAAHGMGIGAHTITHRKLSELSDAEARTEIEGSKHSIEDRVGAPVVAFAYPFGKPRHHFTSSTTRVVSNAGFSVAGSILYRGFRDSDSEYAIPRFPITGDAVERLSSKIYGKLDSIGAWQEHAPVWAAKAIAVDVASPH